MPQYSKTMAQSKQHEQQKGSKSFKNPEYYPSLSKSKGKLVRT